MPALPHCVLKFAADALSTQYDIAMPDAPKAIPAGPDLEGHSPSRWCQDLNIPTAVDPSVVRMLDDWTENMLGPTKGMCVVVSNDDVDELRPHLARRMMSRFTAWAWVI